MIPEFDLGLMLLPPTKYYGYIKSQLISKGLFGRIKDTKKTFRN
jgi:hypothetical protein